MKETENANNSRIKLIAVIIVLTVCISIVTSSIVVKTLVPILPTPTFSPISITQPTVTLTLTQPPVTPTITRVPVDIPHPTTPMQIQMPRIETNLLQNSGFENGLSGWVYTDNASGIYVFETTGVNGKAFCSHRYTDRKDFLEGEWAAFVQEVPIDPTQTYFFSGWVKLNKAIHVYAMAQLYNWSDNIGWAAATSPIGILPDGETTSGWVFVHGEIPRIPQYTNRALVGVWHGLIYNAPNTVDSTICVDDLVFGKIIK
jgi:hypothetical protein